MPAILSRLAYIRIKYILKKQPTVLEFLGMEEKAKYSETDLETALINKLQKFILELGYNSHQRQILQQFTNIRCELQQLMHTKR